MDDSNTLSTGTALLLALTIVLGAVGDLLLSSGMKQVGSVEPGPARRSRPCLSGLSTGEIWLGVTSLLLFFVCLVLLSRVDFSYVSRRKWGALVAVLGSAVLGEAVTVWRWTGIGCICLGVALVTRTPPRTTM